MTSRQLRMEETGALLKSPNFALEEKYLLSLYIRRHCPAADAIPWPPLPVPPGCCIQKF